MLSLGFLYFFNLMWSWNLLRHWFFNLWSLFLIIHWCFIDIIMIMNGLYNDIMPLFCLRFICYLGLLFIFLLSIFNRWFKRLIIIDFFKLIINEIWNCLTMEFVILLSISGLIIQIIFSIGIFFIQVTFFNFQS